MGLKGLGSLGLKGFKNLGEIEHSLVYKINRSDNDTEVEVLLGRKDERDEQWFISIYYKNVSKENQIFALAEKIRTEKFEKLAEKFRTGARREKRDEGTWGWAYTDQTSQLLNDKVHIIIVPSLDWFVLINHQLL